MKVACLGECMVELSDLQKGQARQSFGGDTLNTALYLARLGLDVSYITALGDDPFSEQMISAWQAEGIDTSLIPRLTNRLPGLYAIHTGEAGERSFHYWRDRSPVRELMDLPEFSSIAAALSESDYLYLTGISLSLFTERGRERLLRTIDKLKDNGGKLIFDSNHRAQRWPNSEAARQAYEQVLSKADIVLSTWEDEQQVFGDDSVASCIQRLHGMGVPEIAIKAGTDGCYISTHPEKAPRHFELAESEDAVDTTGAGDSFNAAYIASRLKGHSFCQSVARAQQLAAVIVRHPGAIIAPEFMPDLKL